MILLFCICNGDFDGDGQVTEFEYVMAMLVKTKSCEKENIEMIRARFRELDHDGSGAIDREDLIDQAASNTQQQFRTLASDGSKQITNELTIE